METKIDLLSDEPMDLWDAYLRMRDSSTIFQGSAWMKVVKETYGHKPLYLQATREQQVVGVLPLFLVSIPLLGKIIASDPFTSYGGICADDSATANQLAEAAAELTKSHNASYLEIKNVSEIQNLGPGWRRKEEYCTMLLDLSEGADAVWTGWIGKTRTNVRRAMKANIEVSKGHLNHLDEFYAIVAADMKRLGTPVHSRKFYKNILKNFSDNAQVYLATLNGTAIAGMLAISAKDKIQAYLSVCEWGARNLKPTALLYWTVIQDAAKEGVNTLDFGRSIVNSGTFKFKQGMGGEPEPLNYYYWLHRSKSVPHIDQENKKLMFATKVWSHLPSNVTSWLGPKLMQYVV